MSINKSKVRQSALSLIYAVEENGGGLQDFDLNLFWRISQEKETDHYRQALCKAIAHVARASADSARLLATRAQSVLDALHGDLTASRLVADIERLEKRSSEFDSALAAMRYCAKDKRQDTTDKLELCCRDVIALAIAVEGLGRDMLPSLADFPVYRKVLDPLKSAIMRRGKLMAAVAARATPLMLEGQQEFTGLVRCARVLEELRPAAEEFALAVLARKPQLEERLTALLQNYSTARLDVVDRCILYIALYELEYTKLETPIVVSEANALADAYSGGKSAPFIHGIISAAAKA
ncbi:MAG: hypothetical protein IJY72_07005 [Akkermansia sp.]|nr:hypothetical protein [Akkermansia sp.]